MFLAYFIWVGKGGNGTCPASGLNTTQEIGSQTPLPDQVCGQMPQLIWISPGIERRMSKPPRCRNGLVSPF